MKIVSYDCVNRYHLIARCPACGTGIMMKTCKEDFNGITEANCIECNKPMALYLIMKERKAWMLAEPIEMLIKRVV